MDRGALRRRALPPGDSRREHEGAFVPPWTPAEKVLARIWSEVLGLERIDIHDNFFALGGDSILSIQVIARANQKSLRLVPRDLFRHQTVAELARAATAPPATTKPATTKPATTQPAGKLVETRGRHQPSDTIPLTPIQRWFFERRSPAPWHFNQAVLLRISKALDPALLEQAVAHLLRQSHSLRLRFARRGGAWRQWCSAFDGRIPFAQVDLSRLATEDRRRAIGGAAARLQASLDLTAGPLLRAVYFSSGEAQAERLFVVIHHLAVDLVSWSFLLEDLERAYRRLEAGVPASAVPLPASTAPFREWAAGLELYARSEELQRELEFWLGQPDEFTALPEDRATGANTVASAATVEVALGREETGWLLRRVPQDGTRVLDVLLTALAATFGSWTGGPLAVDLEGHGREAILDGVDVSRTCGWFTTMFPVVLQVRNANTDALRAVGEQMAAVPGHGIGYGLLRYMSPGWEKVEELRARPRPAVCFNYLGQLDAMLAGSALFVHSGEASGSTQSSRGLRDHVVAINAGISDGRLWTDWTYSRNRHRRSTIERLARRFLGELENLITLCLGEPRDGGHIVA